jgi:hypothetical protein
MVLHLLRWMRIHPQTPELRVVKHVFTPLEILDMVTPRTLEVRQLMQRAGHYEISKFHGRPSSIAGVGVVRKFLIPLAYLRNVSI